MEGTKKEKSVVRERSGWWARVYLGAGGKELGTGRKERGSLQEIVTFLDRTG